MKIDKGNPLIMGSEKLGRDYNFSVASSFESLTLLLFDSKGDLKYRVELDSRYKTGSVFSCRLSNVSLEKALYCYEADGRRFVDPYAKTVTDCELFGIEKEQPNYASRVVLDHFDWEGDAHFL